MDLALASFLSVDSDIRHKIFQYLSLGRAGFVDDSLNLERLLDS